VISYAQNFEDVMIARLFPRDHQGFYIDIGAAHPTHLSITKHFYDSGWSGVNVEPLPRFFQKLVANRPRDVNLQAMIGVPSGRRTFFEIAELPENSTSDEQVMVSLKEQGSTVRTHDVTVLSVKEICERYAAERVIDFMKIDVEGGELEVLQSADWQRFRPVLLVIEAVVVNGREETWSQWEWVITEQGYEKVWFDGLNNYYLRRESLSLKEHFRLPPNVFDGFATARLESSGDDEWIDLGEMLKQVEADRQAKQEVVDRLATELASVEADRQAKQEVVDRLATELASVEADRQAKQEVVDRLIAELAAVEADRQAKQEVVDRLIAELAAVEADRQPHKLSGSIAAK
jgi:FkbM family methyltransferase